MNTVYEDTPQAIHRRADAIRKKARAAGMEPVWPYGLNESRLDEREAAVDWAIARHLRWSQGHWCLHWLLTGQCNRTECNYVGWGAGFETLEPLGIHLSGSWLDHVTAWTRDGHPAVLVTQPYDLDDADRAGLEELGRGHGLDVEISSTSGWYGIGTTWIAVHRTGDVSDLRACLRDADCERRRAGDWGWAS